MPELRGSHWIHHPRGRALDAVWRDATEAPAPDQFFRPYVYGASRPALRPEVPFEVFEPPPKPPPKPKRKPKPKPKRKRRKPPKRYPLPLSPLPAPRPSLDEALERMAAATPRVEPVPLPFICSACDPASPMFTLTHYRCSGGDCVCYQQTPVQHDESRRVLA